MSDRKKANKEEPLTEEEKEKLKSLLGRLKESPAASGEEEDQPAEEEEGLTEEEIEKLNKLLGPPNWEQVQQFRKAGRTIAKRAAIAQIIEAMPEGIDTYEAYARGAMPFVSFLPATESKCHCHDCRWLRPTRQWIASPAPPIQEK